MPDRAAPSGWQLLRLDELGTVERGRSRHRPRNDPALYGGPYPFVQTGDIKAAGLRLFSYTQTYSEAGLAQSRMWPAGTLCITIAANICDTAILGIPACFPDSIVGFKAKPGIADAVFVKYALDHAKQRFAGISKGATQDNLSLEKMLSQRLPVPPFATQRRIASILGAYDDLIEVNRRRIALLEEMARRLFEEWFVHFRFPGHEGVRMVETPEGPLPEGWRMVRLDDMLVLQRGFDLPTTARKPGPFPVLGATGSHGTHDEAKVNAPCVTTGRSGSLGVVSLTFRDCWPLNTTLYVREFRRATPAYALFLLRHLQLQTHGGGAAVPTLNRNHLHGLRVPGPPAALIKQFDQHALRWLQLANTLERQQAALAASRDLLLPRLISGDLSVAAAERELETAA
jgi:type I restriction enzyme S subunit